MLTSPLSLQRIVTSSPNTEPAEDSNVIKRKLSKVLQMINTQRQLPKMLEVLKYSRAKPFELVCALAFVSGRSLAELMALGHFSISIGDNSSNTGSACPEVLFALHNSGPANCCSIPLLCDNSTFLAAVDRLRQMKVVQGKECKDINKSHCKTANTAAKTMLECSTVVFTDLRVAYAALTYKLHGTEAESSNEALESQMKAWLATCMPLSKLGRSPAFLAQCCATYLALSLSPAAYHRAGSVTVDNHVGHGPKDLMSANSIVLKVLPLLLRICCRAGGSSALI
jgi:hypothetical protein